MAQLNGSRGPFGLKEWIHSIPPVVFAGNREQEEWDKGMSDQAKETTEGKKKKGKLPVVIVLALVLGAGGFFGMKMRGGEAAKPKTELGEIIEIKDEFLSNMAERNTYVRAKISLQVKKGFDKGKVEKELAPIQDVINMKLQGTSVRSVSTPDGLRKLKQELALDLNKLFEEKPAKKEPVEGDDDESYDVMKMQNEE